MKTIISNAMAVFLLIVASFSSAFAQEPRFIPVAVSPFTPTNDWEFQRKQLQRLILAESPNGSHVVVWDAYQMQVIADARIPRLAFDSPAARAPKVSAALAVLASWNGGLENSSATAPLKDSGAIKFPAWVKMALADSNEAPCSMIVLGSPFYLSQNEPSFSMLGSNSEPRYPSDGHLKGSLDETPYSVLPGIMTGVNVYWAYQNEHLWQNDNHRQLVNRWWALWVQSAGGRLTDFSSDVVQTFKNAIHPMNRPDAGVIALNASDSEMVMHLVTNRVVSIETLKTNSPLRDAAWSNRTGPMAEPALISLDVGVTDSDNRPVIGLGKTEFAVFDNGIQQTTLSSTQERKPVSIVLLIDTSGSMEPKLDKVRAAASTLFSRAVAGDDVCLMEFKTTVSVLQDFTTNTQTAQKALGGLKAGGGTALLDALKFAIEYAHRNGKNDRKGVVCITDGGEADSRCRREDVIPLLKQGNVQFYSIAFPDGLKPTPISNTQNVSLPKPQPSEAEARELMIILSQASGGGLLFFPQEADELPPITEAIVSNLRAPRYTITYQCSSPNTLTGWHSVRVLVHPAADTGGVTVHAREGYFAPETPPPSIPGGGISSRNEISR